VACLAELPATLVTSQEERGALARVDVSMSSDVEPGAAWKLASDLRRFDEWMTIFGGWRGTVPSTIEQGTRVSSLIKVKGFHNVIHWTVTRLRRAEIN